MYPEKGNIDDEWYYEGEFKEGNFEGIGIMHYNENVGNVRQDESIDVDESSEKVIKRHFDKFKK